MLDRVGLPYRWLSAKQIEQEYHFAKLPGTYEGFFQPDGGMVDVRGTLWLLLFLDVMGLGKVVSEAIAIVLVMPLNFIGNKLWSFRG